MDENNTTFVFDYNKILIGYKYIENKANMNAKINASTVNGNDN